MQNAKCKICVIAAAALCAACGHRATTAETPYAGNVLAISDSTLLAGSTDTLRFGQMRAGEIAQQRLRIENHGTSPLVILKYDRTCGCVSIDFSSQPVKPGEAQELTVTFDSSGEWGWVFKKLEITLAGTQKPLQLFVEAKVE